MLTGVFLFGYQNCAPTAGPDGGYSPVVPSSDVAKLTVPAGDEGEVRIPDQTENNNSMALKFVETARAVPVAEALIRADGICSSRQEEAVLRWQLVDSTGDVVNEGFTPCRLSGFTVQVALDSPLACDKTYRLEAQLGLGSKGVLNLTPECSPL